MNLLTIRYHPINPLIKPVCWQDLQPKNTDPTGIKTQKLLERSIHNSRLINEETIVVSLSSGIDSSLCLGLLRKIFPRKKIIAICAIFSNNFDESVQANKIAKRFDAEFKVVKIDSIFDIMPKLVSITHRPRWNTYQSIIVKEATKFSKVLVTGDGADELFGGYVFRYAKFDRLTRKNDNWKTRVINYLECHNRDWVPDQKEMFGSAIKFDWAQIYNIFKPYFQNKLSPINQVMLADFNGKLLYDFIPTGKQICDAYNIQNVPIFLDNNVIDFALKLPLSQKYNVDNKKGKLVLRKIAQRLGIEHIDEKRGFSPDLIIDWNKKGRKICEKYLLDKHSYIYTKNLLNFNWSVRSFEKVDNDGDIKYLNKLISILALEIWYRIFVSMELKPDAKLY